MARHTLRINQPRMQAAGMRQANRLVTRTTRQTDNRSAVLCPVDTGNLRASRSSSVRELAVAVIGRVVYRARYAAAVHNGRRALTIRAKRRDGRLRFQVGGRTVYARQVHQPARAGRPFLTTALREVAVPAGFRVRTRVR